MALPRIELGSRASETRILSIVLQGQINYKFVNYKLRIEANQIILIIKNPNHQH